MKILVTGGSGFIGSNFVKLILAKEKTTQLVNVDNLTYAAKGNNIQHMGLEDSPDYKFYKADIKDSREIDMIFSKEKPEIVVNFAAESHVDRSIENPSEFISTNILGTYNLLEASKKQNVSLFIQISTDEVYGSLDDKSPSSKESDPLNPRSPYSASKAAAEQIAMSYFHTFGFPVIVTRSSNNYGPYQFPEKLLPLFITNLLEGKKVPLMYSRENPGMNIRDWLHVEDNCRAILFLIKNGKIGELYNINGGNEKKNIEVTRLILKNMHLGEDMIEFVPHRLGHDFRYSINDGRLLGLGFKRNYNDFEEGLKETIIWYKNNRSWWGPLKLNTLK